MLFGCMVFMHGFSAYGVTLREEVMSKEQQVSQLQDEIKQIDSELARCKDTKSKWKTTTILGSLGVAATGAAAIIQTVNANKEKKALEAETSPGAKTK